jgi:hypothetical protein
MVNYMMRNRDWGVNGLRQQHASGTDDPYLRGELEIDREKAGQDITRPFARVTCSHSMSNSQSRLSSE